ncbi:asparagine synthetase B [bacterium]|nr:asparagine synthetase B [bacterium]
MCGLWAYFLRAGRLFDGDAYLRHDPFKHASASRGPDRMLEVQGADYHFCFHRLAIHDLSPDGDQPFCFHWPNGVVLHLMCNGEIYNDQQLIKMFKLENRMQSKSDCEVICHLLELYEGSLDDVVPLLDGEFAFVARMEYPDGSVMVAAARDSYGVRPLYYGSTEKGVAFSSLLHGVAGLDSMTGCHFPPGHIYREWISDANTSPDIVPFAPNSTSMKKELVRDRMDMYKVVTSSLIEAVQKRLSSDREIGFLLSGGLDSSLVLAIASKILKVKSPHAFTIVMDENATDLKYAKMVAQHLGVKHTIHHVSANEAIESIPDVIRCIETYDITTIRASTPQYLLAKYISEKTKVRVVLNGDGSDEVANGYLYNYYCPSDEAAEEDTHRLLSEIHMYDGLRVDRTLGSHGLEARLPFLDPKYVTSYLDLPISDRRVIPKQQVEKQLLRDAFATLYPDLLPEEVMYRRKEAFSDAVTSQEASWYQIIQDKLREKNKTESQYYQDIFDHHFPNHRHVLPHYWMPRWVPSATDPSARTLSIY